MRLGALNWSLEGIVPNYDRLARLLYVGNMPERMVYSVTVRGKKLLKETLISFLSTPEDTLSELTFSLLVMNHLDKETVLESLNQYKDKLTKEIKARRKLLSREKEHGISASGLVALNHILGVLKVSKKTVNNLIQTIENYNQWKNSPIPFWRNEI
jgi:hypothetical protein